MCVSSVQQEIKLAIGFGSSGLLTSLCEREAAPGLWGGRRLMSERRASPGDSALGGAQCAAGLAPASRSESGPPSAAIGTGHGDRDRPEGCLRPVRRGFGDVGPIVWVGPSEDAFTAAMELASATGRLVRIIPSLRPHRSRVITPRAGGFFVPPCLRFRCASCRQWALQRGDSRCHLWTGVAKLVRSRGRLPPAFRRLARRDASELGAAAVPRTPPALR